MQAGLPVKISLQEFFDLKSNFNGPNEVEILTGSMAPFINPGEKVLVFPLGNKKLEKFDPIIYWQSDKLICHFYYREVTTEKGSHIITKSLNSPKDDPPVQKEHILGIVVRPKLPRWKRFMLRLLK